MFAELAIGRRDAAFQSAVASSSGLREVRGRLRRAPRTCSGGVDGTMPCPRLKDGPVNRAGGADDVAGHARRRSPGSVSSASGSRLPCSDHASPLAARAHARSTVQSRPTHARAARGDVGSHAPPPPLVNTIVGIAVAATACDDRAHRPQRETGDTRRGEEPAPRVEASSRRPHPARSARVRYRVTARALSVDQRSREKVRPRVRHPAHGRRKSVLPPPSIM